MNIKHTINKYEELNFEHLTAEMQALFWFAMHCSNQAGFILLSPSLVMKRLNLANTEYAQSLLNRFCEEYPFMIKGKTDYLYLLTSKILDQYNLPLNCKYTRHVGVLKDLYESIGAFRGIPGFDAFFEEHIKDSYDEFLKQNKEVKTSEESHLL